jgi:antitoxin VapB
MGLNIKNEKVCALAKEAAATTGQSQTSVVEQALQELLERRRETTTGESRTGRIDAILDDLQRNWADTAGKRIPVTDDLYDKNGLPR